MNAIISGSFLGSEQRMSKGENPKPYMICDIYQVNSQSRNKTISVMTNDVDVMNALNKCSQGDMVSLDVSITANKGFLNVFANQFIEE